MLLIFKMIVKSWNQPESVRFLPYCWWRLKVLFPPCVCDVFKQTPQGIFPLELCVSVWISSCCICRLQPLSSCPDSLPSVQGWAPVQPGLSGLSVQTLCPFCRCELVARWRCSEQRDLHQHSCPTSRQVFPNQQPSVHPDVRLGRSEGLHM